MIAILKHELRLYFHSLTAYIFGAFLLIFVGIGAMLYNLQASVSNFEYVLNFSNIIFVAIVPLLTMRVIAEEKKQKTDQLLYSLPVSTTKVILGKYLALLIMFLIPVALICTYPLIFSQFGDVYLLTAYGSLLAYFILGAALIALGVFISCLTENQGLAAGIGVVVILFNYFSVTLAEYVSSTALGSVIAFFVIAALLGLLVRYITKSGITGLIVTLLLFAGIAALFFFKQTAFEGLLPSIMQRFSLFERFNIFANGIFDVPSIVYYGSFVVFFLFLSVQALEKRRYS